MEKLNPQSIENIFALTPLQEGMLFHYLQSPQGRLYSEQLSLEISGKIDNQLFEKAWNIVIETNEMMRTLFRWEKLEKPSQIILKEYRCSMIFHDLSAKDSVQKKTALAEIKTKDSNEGFDLTRVPFRVILCKLDERKYEMVVSNHHILYDGWSNGIILKEFFQAYHELGLGEESLKTPVKTPFKEFIKWIQKQDRNKQEQFWRDYLTGIETPTELSIKRRMEKTTGVGDYSIILAEDIKNKLDDFVKNNRVTLASVFYAAWGILLQKYCDCEDVIFGTTISGRSGGIKGIEDMVGLFINTVPLRTQTSSNEKIIEVVFHTDQVLREREEFENTSPLDIRSYSSMGVGSSLFDTIMSIENYPLDNRLLPENSLLAVNSYSIAEMTHYDLSVGIMPFNEIEIKFSFKSGLFEKDAIENLAGHFKRIIQNMIENPETALSQLEIISIEEKHRILYEFNNTAAEYPCDKTIHQLFVETALRTSDRIALVGADLRVCPTLSARPVGQVSLTYGELGEQSDHLAGLLLEKGVLADTILGIMMERSVELIIGIMGILKAGGAYLPIDPNYPKERIDYMLKDCNAKILINKSESPWHGNPIKNSNETNPNDQRINVQNKNFEDLMVLNLDRLNFEFVSCFEFRASDLNSLKGRPRRALHHSNLAYLIYTSGSTGRPKGVAVEHSQVVNFLFHMFSRYGGNVDSDDRCLSLTNIMFDVSVWEFFLPLMFGARLVMLTEGRQFDVTALVENILREEITLIYIPPGLLEEVTEQLKMRPGHVRLNKMLVGVEPIRDEVLEDYMRLNPGMKIINGYGPTETAVCAASYNYWPHEPKGEIVPIGAPLSNNQIILLDDKNHLVPQGVPGEICISGAGVSRGYINNPVFTAEKYRPHPYFKNKRMYHTGDLARLLPDGNLLFIGRRDNQLKIRGYRIELGEIENRLLKHDQIKEAVTLAKEDNAGDKYLAVYFVSDHKIAEMELKQYLAKELPEYMIPLYFTQMEKMPLTSNGKVDRKALPEPKLRSEEIYVAPRSEMEKKLVEIWGRVLGKDISLNPIGIDDHFFRLGGHSLKATSLVSLIYKTFNVKIPLGEIFKRPTIRGLYDYINVAAEEKYEAVEQVEKQEYYELSSSQKRLYFLQQMDTVGIAYNISAVWILEGVLDKCNLEEFFTKLIERHESLRTSFVIIAAEPQQVIHDQVKFKIDKSFAELFQKRLPEEGRPPEAIIKSFIRPFDLSQAPLMRVGLVGLEEGRHLLMVDMHHIISDGISTGILIREFTALYSGEELPPIRLQYKDYAEWQRGSKQGKNLLKQSAYWKKEFEGETPVLELPTDYARLTVQNFEGDRITFTIGRELVDSLELFALEMGTTLYMVLLASYSIFLSKLSGQEDIIIGTPVGGRRYAEFEKIIGVFVNTLALRSFPAGEKNFIEFLAEIKEKALGAFENQDYPYEDLVERLTVNRNAGRNPVFDVMFGLQNMGSGELEIPGLKIVPYEFENKTAKFDLALTGIEIEGRLEFTFEYCTRLFKEKTIERFILYYKNILFSIIQDKDQRLSGMEMLPGEEKNRLIFEFNNTAAEYPVEKTIHQLFEEQMSKTPDRIALIGNANGEEKKRRREEEKKYQLTYRQLNEQSNYLAGLLIAKGVLPDTIVGIMMERSIEMIIGILGTLKAGGAYLPIDREYPQERIDYILKDSNARILINKSENSQRGEFRASDLNSLNACSHRGLHHSSFIIHHSNQLAYVIYTSGSTGRPRGVMVEHRNVGRLVKNTNYIHFLPQDRLLPTGSPAFDITTFEIWGPLCNGAMLALVSKDVMLNTEKLKEVLVNQDITILHLIPQLFNQLAGHDMELFAGLRYFLVGGDLVSPVYINALRQKYSDLNILHMYGPTENTTFSTFFPVERDYEFTIPIGNAIANTTVYIVNKYGYLQPVGVMGELCVGGEGIARGYLNNPELTAEKFNRDLWDKNFHHSKLYRTGDLARWLPDPAAREAYMIEFLGRIDQQVKIRGFRVELVEIEDRLLKHKHVKAAVVISSESNIPHLCAYIVLKNEKPEAIEKAPDAAELKEFLSLRLPAYMIPTHFFLLEKIPLTPNGKIDREALQASSTLLETGVEYVAPKSDIERIIADVWKVLLGLDKVGIHDNFFDLGGNSLSLIRLNSLLKGALPDKKDLSVVTLFKHPTIASLARYLERVEQETESTLEAGKIKPRFKSSKIEIAVIGMAGRFPGSKDIIEFWNNIKNGVESISFFTQEQLKQLGVKAELINNPDYVPAKGVLESKEYFDSHFFGYTPAEVEILDPQVRIFHECAWEALENAGYDSFSYDGAIGLYAGASPNPLWEISPLTFVADGSSYSEIWNAVQFSNKDFLSTRIAYKLDLKGPCVTIQTACSTSLVAIDHACWALINGTCDIALAGGVSVAFQDEGGYLYQEGTIMSPDGHCRAFDADAKGALGGDGAGVVVLKWLEQAEADGDTIYGLIKGFAANNDGRNKVGFTAPSSEGQAKVIRGALDMAGVHPESIGYIEAHGTGTELGDPIEIEGLKMAFNAAGSHKKHYCAVGSIKTNIGHLDAAAGIAGFIKTVLSLYYRFIPPSLNFKSPNPRIDFENSPFYVNTELKPWKNNEYPLRAGVSSIGLGGTNAHVILEEYTKQRSEILLAKKENTAAVQEVGGAAPPAKTFDKVILLSAKTPLALEKMSENLANHFEQHPNIDLNDAAYTLQIGRKAFVYRKMLVCSDLDEVIGKLPTAETGSAKEEKHTIIFMFSGQGSQYVNMGLNLYQNLSIFHHYIDECFNILEKITGIDMKPILYPNEEQIKEAEEKIFQFKYTTPIKFSFEYSLAKTLMSWGITPDAMIGHSFGEYVAACLSGVFSLEDGLFLAALRGELMHNLPDGAMLSVPLSEKELQRRLSNENELDIAAINADSLCIVSGPISAVNRFETQLNQEGHECLLLQVPKAGHSHMVEPIMAEFKQKIGKVKFNKIQIPFISCVSGTWMKAEEAVNPDYWTQHLRKPVRFADGLTHLFNESNPIFLQTTPGKGLILFINQHPNHQVDTLTLNMVRHHKEPGSDVRHTLTQIGRLWLNGVDSIDWQALYQGEKRRRIPLPSYPFEAIHYPVNKELF